MDELQALRTLRSGDPAGAAHARAAARAALEAELRPGAGRRRRWPLVVAAAAAVVLVAVLVVRQADMDRGQEVHVTDERPVPSTEVGVGAGPIPRVVPELVPEGFAVRAWEESSGAPSPPARFSPWPMPVRAFGVLGEHGLPDGWVALTVAFPDGREAPAGAPAAATATLLGQQVPVRTVEGRPFVDIDALVEIEGRPARVNVSARDVPAADVAAFAATVTMAPGSPHFLDAPAPPGMTSLHEGGWPAPAGGSSTLQYSNDPRLSGGVLDDEARMAMATFTINASAVPYGHLREVVWRDPLHRPTTLEGRPAALLHLTEHGRTKLSLRWLADGILYDASSIHLSEEALRAVAASIRPVPEAQWEAVVAGRGRIQETDQPVDEPSSEPVLAARDVFADGTEIRVLVHEGRGGVHQLCERVEWDGSLGGGSCFESYLPRALPGEVGRVATNGSPGYGHHLLITTGPDITAVRIEYDGAPARVLETTQPLSWYPVRYAIAAIDQGKPRSVTGRRDGRDVFTQPVTPR